MELGGSRIANEVGVVWVSEELKDAFVLSHMPPGGDELGDYMLIGVYSSRDAALAAVARLCGQPGFRDHPEVIDDTEEAGFFVSRYTID